MLTFLGLLFLLPCATAAAALPAPEWVPWPDAPVNLRQDSSPRLIEDCSSVAEWRTGVTGLLSDEEYTPAPGTLRVPPETGIYRYFGVVDLEQTPVLELGVKRARGQWRVTADLVESCWKAGGCVLEAAGDSPPGLYRVNLARRMGWRGTLGSVAVRIDTAAGAELELGFVRLRRDPAVPRPPELALQITRVDRRARIEGQRVVYTLTPVLVARRSGVGTLSLVVTDRQGRPLAGTRSQKEVRLRAGENRLTLTYSLPLARTWTPEHPHRLRARIRFAGAAGSCQVVVRAGQPVLEARAGRLLVNGRDTPIRGIGYTPREGRWPLANPRAVMAADLRVMKRMGCNAIKQWGRCPDDMLALAEEHGFFVLEGIGICYDYPAAKHEGFITAKADELAAILRGHRDSPALLCVAFGYELQGDAEKIRAYVEAMQRVAKRVAPEVLTTYAGLPDVIDWELPVDLGSIQIYTGHDSQRLRAELQRYRERLGERPLLVAEYGHHSRRAEPLTYYRAWQAEGYQLEWRALRQAGAIGGFAFMWDDRGRPGQQADDKESFFGLHDASDRPKMAFYFVGEMFGGFRLVEAPAHLTYAERPRVVLAEGATARERWAAEDLVRAIPGASFAESATAGEDARATILIGTASKSPLLRAYLKDQSLKPGEGLIRVVEQGAAPVVLLAGGDEFGTGLAVQKYLYLGLDRSLGEASGPPLTFRAAAAARDPVGGKQAWLVTDRPGSDGACVAMERQYAGIVFRGLSAAAIERFGARKKLYLWLRLDHGGAPAYYYLNRGLGGYYAIDGDGSGWQWLALEHAVGPERTDGLAWESDELEFSLYLRAHRVGMPVYVDRLVVTPDAAWRPDAEE